MGVGGSLNVLIRTGSPGENTDVLVHSLSGGLLTACQAFVYGDKLLSFQSSTLGGRALGETLDPEDIFTQLKPQRISAGDHVQPR